MINNTQMLCEYLSSLYDATYKETKDLVFVYMNKSIFKVNLKDGVRFGSYTLFHTNKLNQHYHIQLKSTSLFKILFYAFAHDFNKENKIWIEVEDIQRLKYDLNRLKSDLLLKQSIINDKYILCPVCGEKLKTISQNGTIRHSIYCRCMINHRTTKLRYKTNIGYDYLRFYD